MNTVFNASSTSSKFMRSSAFGRVMTGPVGSGKTTTMVMELLRRSCAQSPGQNGVRYTRHAIVRQTLKQLKDTVLKDCEQWLAGVGMWKVSEGTFHVEFDDVKSEWIFIPLEDAEDQARLLSMQLTGAWLSEAIEMDLNILGPVSGRLGRYPSGPRGNPSWFGIIADTNMPVELSPWWQFMENLPPNWQKFSQPSGMDPAAENLNYLLQTEKTRALPLDDPRRIAQGRSYYENLVQTYGEDSDWVKRYVYAQYGDDPSGMAVFKQTFRPSFHIVDETLLIPGYQIIVGQDFGRNPWSLICQVDHLGRLLVHEEVAGTNVGLEKHVQQALRPALFQAKYSGFHDRIAVVGDPAGVAKGSIAEESCFDALKRLGFAAFPAPTNDIEPRLRAVEALLGRQTNGGPSLLINRTGCPFLCRAMSGGYRFTKTKAGALRPVPDKNDKDGFSHVADALQYVALVVHGNMMDYIGSRMKPRKNRLIRKISPLGWT